MKQVANSVDLPSGWAHATIGMLVPFDGVFNDGDWVESKDQDRSGNVRLIQLADIGDGRFLDKSARFLTKQKAHQLNCTFLDEGDLLIARMPDPLGRACVFPLAGPEKFVTVVDVCIVRLGQQSANTRFLMHLINSPSVRSQIESFKTGSTRKRISRKNLEKVALCLPPRREQDRIVAKIEELFSELDDGIQSLKAAREQLKIYRQVLLKNAFEGNLTEQWRLNDKAPFESVATGLGRIQQSSAIPNSDLEKMPSLPRGWTYLRLGEVIDEPKYGTAKKCDYKYSGTGVLRIPNIVSGLVDDSDLKYANFDRGEIEAFELRRGDILLIRSNGSISIVGRCALVSERDEKYLYAGYLIRMRPNQDAIDPRYLHSVLSSHALRVQIEGKAKSTSGVNNINAREIQSLIIPVCRIEEQREVMNFLDEKIPVLDRTEQEINLQIRKADALRQSILERAFSGKLVAQDPDDEPASLLLKRIRAEKTEKENNKKRNGRRKAA